MLTYGEFLLEHDNNIEDDFRFWVDEITGWLPRGVGGFSKDIMTLLFSEEVKDGRSPKFNEYDISKLKDKTFTHREMSIKILDVEMDGEPETDPYEYSIYYYYRFKLKTEKI